MSKNSNALKARSSVTNGALLPDVDGRTQVARRYRDLFQTFGEDLGGMDRLSEAERQLLRRGAALSCLCEAAEAQMAKGESVDLAEYLPSINTLRRVFDTVGLRRRAADVTPNFVEALSAAQAEDEQKWREQSA